MYFVSERIGMFKRVIGESTMRNFSKRTFLAILTAFAANPSWSNSKPYWSTRKTGFAADGADVVAYHSLSKKASAVMGKNEFKTEWKGGLWRFTNAQNLAKFQSNPEVYAPKFGGYCSLSVAHGGTSTGDRNAWHIHKGRLYLNGSKRARRKWRGNMHMFIRWAESKWPDVLSA